DVSLQIDCSQTRVGLIPHLCRDCVTAQEFLVFEFVSASIENEKIGSGVADAVAENDIETKAHLVDEIVHVALEASVIVAEKHHPLLVVEKHPTREMDGAYPSQSTAIEDMPRKVVHESKNEDRRPETHGSGF